MTPPHPSDLQLDHASADRLDVLFDGWPAFDRQRARMRVRGLIGFSDDCTVWLSRRGQCVLLTDAGTGHATRIAVPRGF